MQLVEDKLLLAPSDLTSHLACPRLTQLNRAVALGERARPRMEDDPHLDLIRRRGDEHEAEFLAELRRRYGAGAVVEIPRPGRGPDEMRAAAKATRDAMDAGVQVIFQAAFLDDAWRGFADFVVRVARPSALGDFSYEVLDTKLARSFKPEHAHQLCRYSLHVGAVQDRVPDAAGVVLGTGERVFFRLADVLALHRYVVAQLTAALANGHPIPEPELVRHCDVCDFSRECRGILRARDDLSFVATLGRDQRAKLGDVGVQTLAALAAMTEDADHGTLSAPTFARLRTQAQLQLLTRETGELRRRHRAPERARGYARLPAPSPGDVFFDLEGDLFAGEEGLEYLWGYELLDGEPSYHAIWAHDEGAERTAFEGFVDLVVARRAAHPDLHVFHYAPHELSTLRRLAAKYETREAEIDGFLRDGVLVDLYAVVREALQVGQEGYSIKQLEPFYMEARESTIREAGGSMVAYERWLEARSQDILDEIAAYNAEDCRSTRLLRDWLLELRDEAAAQLDVDFDALREPEPETPLADPEWVEPLAELQARVEAGLPDQAIDDTPDQAERRLLGRLLFYHRREAKPAWWRFFALCDMSVEDLEGERDAIANLTVDPDEGPYPDRRSTCTWLRFPEQEHRLKPGAVVDPATGRGAGTMEALEADRLLLRRGPGFDGRPLPRALIAPGPIDTKQQRRALIGVADALLDGGTRFPAVRALLRGEPPRLRDHAPGEPIVAGVTDVAAAIDATLRLQESCLAVQGPPGSGKTYTGARVVVAALAAGRRVAVSATSHDAIHNLVGAIEEVAVEKDVPLRAMHKCSDERSRCPSPTGLVQSTTGNEATTDPALNLVSGTPWLFARAEHEQQFDLLVIDEAGQMALADAVAIGTCAQSMLLLGDPQQLAQVSQGIHPPGADASVLEHVLGDADTISPEGGVFLDHTWRMHPEICEFISERFYDGRLRSVDGCEPQRVDAGGRLFGAGLRFLGVEHHGRSQDSPEEAELIAACCRDLLDGGTATTRERGTRPLAAEDILVVAPYNLAVRRIAAAVPEGVRVGTVDRFQGQEAPVVFYAMTSSTGADAPRGLDFLFESNRLNVAISRAQCLAVLIASPRLMDAECRGLGQMRMVNHVCRYVELADAVPS